MKKIITTRPFHYFIHTLTAVLLLLKIFAANAQTQWTHRYLTPQQQLFDVAYGAGKYVALGAGSMVHTSTDGASWTTQPTELSTYGTLASIIYVNNRFVAVGGPGVIITSPNGISWTKQVSGTTNILQSIAYGNGTYVIVGSIGSILTSTDGVNWTPRAGGLEYLHDVTYLNDIFVAVGSNGLIKTSYDNGVTWTMRTSGTINELRAVAAGKYGSFVAVGDYGTILYSSNGLTWTLMPGPDKKMFLSGVASNPANGRFVIVSSNKHTALASPDGVYWGGPPVQTGSNQIFYRVRFLQNSLLAVGSNGTLLSSYNNGATWSSPATDFRNMQLNGSAYGNGYYVAVGSAPLGNGTTGLGRTNLALVSTDGVEFTAGETVKLYGGGISINDVAWGDNLFVAVGSDALIQTSQNGKNWSYSQVTFGKTLRGVAYGNGKFVAVGDNGLILYSKYGKTWTKSTSAAIYSYKSVTFANGMFVLVGPAGVLATSTDGNFWMYRYTGTKNNLKSVAYGNGKWIAVGLNNTMVTSSNGLQWITVSSTTSLDNVGYTDIVYGNNQFVITGLSGRIYRYVPNAVWASPLTYAYDNLNTITYANGRFVVGGNAGNLLTAFDSSFDASPSPVLAEAEESCGTCRTALDEQTTGEEETSKVAFSAATYPNPVDDQFSVNIEGAAGDKVRLQLLDLSGRTIVDKVVNVETGAYQETIPMAQKQTGMYLLRVSTATKTQTLKILKR